MGDDFLRMLEESVRARMTDGGAAAPRPPPRGTGFKRSANQEERDPEPSAKAARFGGGASSRAEEEPLRPGRGGGGRKGGGGGGGNSAAPPPPRAASVIRIDQPDLSEDIEEALEDNGPEDGALDESNSKKWSAMRVEPAWAPNPVVLAERKELDQPQPANECFGCMWMRGDSDAIPVDKMKAIENLIKGKLNQCERVAAAKAVSEYYMRFIRQPTLPPRILPQGVRPLPEWRPSTVLAHFEEHLDDYTFVLQKRRREVRGMLDHISRNSMFVWATDRHGRRMKDVEGKDLSRVNYESAKTYGALVMLEMRLYPTDQRRSAMLVGSRPDDLRAGLSLEGKKFYATNGADFTGSSPSASSIGAGVGGTVAGQNR